jgi:hypothetical protein
MHKQQIVFDAINALKLINNLDMCTIPRYVENLVAPYVREGVDIPVAGKTCMVGEEDDLKKVSIYKFQFLSDHCLKLVAENVWKKQDLYILSNFQLDRQITEEIMINGGIMTPTHKIWENSEFLRSNWEFFNDPGFNTIITAKHSLIRKEIPDIPYCSRKTIFKDQSYQHIGDITDIDSESLMISKMRNYLFGECFSIDHDNKKIYFWQSTSSDLTDHPIKSTTLSKVMNGLGMLDEKNEASKYKLVIVFCTDWSRETTHGSKFKIERVNENTNQAIDNKSNSVKKDKPKTK